jgi:heme A synthase
MTVTYRFALVTVFATFVLLLVGGTVNPTGSSLACPDWPTCYGSFTPEMTDGVEFEHTHRAVATLVGLLTCILGIMIWRLRTDEPELKRLGWAAVAMVVIQGLLGGLTVILKLPPAISMAHLALSMFFFSFMIYLAHRLRPPSPGQDQSLSPNKAPRIWAAFAAVAIYLQILLGGLVRHSAAGTACGESLPWCNGQAWPLAWPEQVHMIHRYGGIIVGIIVVLAAANVAWHSLQNKKGLAFQMALISPFLIVLQIVLGVMTVQSRVGVVEVTLHLGAGALLLGNWVVAYLAMGPQVERLQNGLRVIAEPHESSAVEAA